MKKVELLAPAGNYESFLGALHAGADAAYLGGDKFGARAYADNFQSEELCRAVRYAHLFGRKVYLTLNTLVKETEFEAVFDYVKPFYEAGLDGVIVQDLGVFRFMKEFFPSLPIHVSTQMTVTGVYGAAFLKQEGAARIVPARELSLQEIRAIKKETGLEIETFIHGAMCYCYSGQCLFSSILGGRSGNRGRCAQPCRLPYEVHRGDKLLSGAEYPLSLKDMCTIQHIPELIRAGIDSFKIEGRMKRPEYAAGVTAVYRKYIDLYYSAPEKPFQVLPEDMRRLEALYIRSEIQDGYYFRHNGAKMVTTDKPSYTGSDEKLLQEIRGAYIEEPLRKELSIYAYFYEGAQAVVTASCEDLEVTVLGENVQKAVKQPVTDKNIKDGLIKLGNTAFTVKDIAVQAAEGIFYPLKEIKELRRRMILDLEEEMLKMYSPETARRGGAKQEIRERKTQICRGTENVSEEPQYHICVSDTGQLQAVKKSSLSPGRIYLDSDMCGNVEESIALFDSIRSDYREKGRQVEVFVAMPYILRRRDADFLKAMLPVLSQADGCLFRNMETYGFLQQNGYKKSLCSDAGVYIWNRQALAFWQDKIDMFCLPYELNRKENGMLRQCILPCEQVIYGYLPMMVTANCVAKTTGGCQGNREDIRNGYALKDRYQKKFPVYTNCKHCYNVIYNSIPLSLHSRRAVRPERLCLRLDFTIETEEETGKVLEYFKALEQDPAQQPPYGEYTAGHEKRGVE